MSLGGAVGSGLAPKVELGPAASLAFAPARYFRVGVSGALFFGHQYGAAPGLSLNHQSLALLACAMPLSGSLSLGVCANGALHFWSSRGISLPYPESHQSSSWTTGLALRAEWRLVRRLWWVGSLGADVAPRPLYFYFTDAPAPDHRFRQQRVSAALFLGLTLELP